MRVVLGEDEALMRHGLVLLLERAGFSVVGVAANEEELVGETEHHRPDLVVTDIRMPPDHRDEGLRAAARVKARWPEIGVVVLSHHAQRGVAVDLLRDHATGIGYLLKQRVADVDQFLADLRSVAHGRTVIDPDVVSLLMTGAPRAATEGLTDRQERVLGLMARGYSNAAIARELSLSEKSVVHHVSHIYDILGLELTPDAHRRVQAVVRHLSADRWPGPLATSHRIDADRHG